MYLKHSNKPTGFCYAHVLPPHGIPDLTTIHFRKPASTTIAVPLSVSPQTPLPEQDYTHAK